MIFSEGNNSLFNRPVTQGDIKQGRFQRPLSRKCQQWWSVWQHVPFVGFGCWNELMSQCIVVVVQNGTIKHSWSFPRLHVKYLTTVSMNPVKARAPLYRIALPSRNLLTPMYSVARNWVGKARRTYLKKSSRFSISIISSACKLLTKWLGWP